MASKAAGKEQLSPDGALEDTTRTHHLQKLPRPVIRCSATALRDGAKELQDYSAERGVRAEGCAFRVMDFVPRGIPEFGFDVQFVTVRTTMRC